MSQTEPPSRFSRAATHLSPEARTMTIGQARNNSVVCRCQSLNLVSTDTCISLTLTSLSASNPPPSSSSGADLNPWKASRRRTTEQEACLAGENSPWLSVARDFQQQGREVESRASHRPRRKFLHELQGLVCLLAISDIYLHVPVNSIIHHSHSSGVGWHGRPAGLFIHLSSSLLHPVKDLVFRPPTTLSCQRSVGEPGALSSAGIHTLEAGALFLLGKLCRLVCTVDVGSLRGGLSVLVLNHHVVVCLGVDVP